MMPDPTTASPEEVAEALTAFANMSAEEIRQHSESARAWMHRADTLGQYGSIALLEVILAEREKVRRLLAE